MSAALSCYNCHKNLDFEVGKKIHRSEECPHCNADLRCCKMCQFYDPKVYNECREPSAERIVEKEKANYCDFFVLANPGSAQQDKQDALSAAMSLFKKG